jgi:hypothetical protein
MDETFWGKWMKLLAINWMKYSGEMDETGK